MDKVFETAQIKLFHLPLKNGYTYQDFSGILKLLGEPLSDKTELQISLETPDSEHPVEHMSSPVCPKCGVKMVKRRVSKGEKAGKANQAHSKALGWLIVIRNVCDCP